MPLYVAEYTELCVDERAFYHVQQCTNLSVAYHRLDIEFYNICTVHVDCVCIYIFPVYMCW